MYASGNFSMLVNDSAGTQVVYERNSSEWQVSAYVDELRLDLCQHIRRKQSAGMQGYGVSNAYGDDTTGKKLQEWKSAYDYGARGVSAVTDTAAINAGIAAIHTAGGGSLPIINEFISTALT